ncbi:hypothetical protein ACFL6Z_09855 [Pseudomonadota bacterium]
MITQTQLGLLRIKVVAVCSVMTCAVIPSCINAEHFSSRSITNLMVERDSKHRHSGGGRHGYNRHLGSSVRWGLGYNNYWGPSVGIGWSSGWNNRWGYRGWGNDWRYPYRYDYYDRYYRDRYMNNRPRSNYVQKSTPIAAAKHTTTSIEYAKGLTKLPDNARVVQRDGHTYYQWDGQEYYFDWSTERYLTVSQDAQ